MTIEEAQKRIAAILQELEESSGSVVRELSVIDVETTRISDDRRRFARRVMIELERLPGTSWVQ